MCHQSGVRQFLLPTVLAAALAAGGCASPQSKALAKQERALVDQNSRAAEERRMRALNYGDVASPRGAEVLVPNPTKTFDPTQSGIGTIRPVNAGGVRTKEFNFDQKTASRSFLTRAFGNSKSNVAADRNFVTGAVDTHGKYPIPKAAADATKTAATTNLWDGNKVAATQGAHDGTRPYLGTESKRMNNAVEAKALANWRNSEAVIYHDSYVERVSSLKQLSIEDVRELLNKNK